MNPTIRENIPGCELDDQSLDSTSVSNRLCASLHRASVSLFVKCSL